MFDLSSHSLNRDKLHEEMAQNAAGAIVVFEGWVRNHNEGKKVSSLEYQVYPELARKEGEKILKEAKDKFNLHDVRAVHREGHLALGEVAIWIGATASHRDDAFKATRYVIDEIKHRLPVWKKEHYVDQKAEWVFCKHHHHHVHFSESEYYQKQNKLIDQKKLKDSHVTVIGAGGLGCPALQALAMAGIGKITIVDFDRITISNIHRQPLYSPNLVGEKKALVARQRLLELNPFIQVEAIDALVDATNALEILSGTHLVLDCTDSMKSKYLIHDTCLKLRIPLVSASIHQHLGQLRTFVPGESCLRCLSDETPDDKLLGNCNDFGVVGVTTQVMGSLQAAEALKFLQKASNSTVSHTLFYDVNLLEQTLIKNFKKNNCSACRGELQLEISPFDLSLTELNQDIRLVDIREMSDSDVEKFKNYSGKIALCCHRGNRSHRLASELQRQGHQHIFSVKGGHAHL
jgi:sulfur-carrier protein adenylyltransferase/sulfurtransferase